MPEMLSFIIENMATKDDVHALDKRVAYIEQNMTTKDDLKRFATKEDLNRFATKEDLMETNNRIKSLERGQREILDILEPLSRAFDKDTQKLMEHGRDITGLKRQIVMIRRNVGLVK